MRIRNLMQIAALGTLVHALAPVAAAQGEPAPGAPPMTLEDLELPGEVVAEGVYRMTFGGFDSGTERFRITEVEAGYVVGAIHRPSGGGQKPFAVVVCYARDGRFRSATHWSLDGEGGVCEYRAEGGSLEARCGEQVRAETLPGGRWIAAYSTFIDDFALLRATDLDVGESASPTYFTFDSSEQWEWGRFPNRITRLEDRRIELEEGKRVTLRRYRQDITFPGLAEFVRTTLVDDRGLPVRVLMKMPFGVLVATLEGFEIP